ncbi:MAG: spermidine/putrescine transport system permease protein [Gaiellales bacterium]|nr:spermidine/putrescine transport system permease protein [Gaiellales bacterium]
MTPTVVARGVPVARPAPAQRRRQLGPWLQLAPVTAYYLIFFLVPLGILVAYSFATFSDYTTTWNLTLDNYSQVLHSQVFRALFLRTLKYAAIVSMIVLALAYPFAYALTFVFTKRRQALYFLVLVSLFGGYLVRIYSWRTLLGEKGLLNTGLMGIGIIDQPSHAFLNSGTAIVIVLVNFLLPLGVLPIYSAMQNLSPGLIEASRDLGGGPLHTIRRVILPLTMRGAAAAFAFTFIATAAEWVTPQLVGGTGNQFVGNAISYEFGTDINWPLGAALALSLIVAVVIVVAIVLGLARWVTR